VFEIVIAEFGLRIESRDRGLRLGHRAIDFLGEWVAFGVSTGLIVACAHAFPMDRVGCDTPNGAAAPGDDGLRRRCASPTYVRRTLPKESLRRNPFAANRAKPRRRSAPRDWARCSVGGTPPRRSRRRPPSRRGSPGSILRAPGARGPA